MEENNLTKEPINSHKKRNIIIATVIAALLLIALAVFLVVHFTHKKDTNNPDQPVQENLSELHVFPPIEFADSLYYKKTVVSYADESPRDVFYYAKDSLGLPTDVKVHETHYYEGEKENRRSKAQRGQAGQLLSDCFFVP